MKQFLWKIGGEAGFGILTTGIFFSKIAARLGYHIFDYIEYPSLIRGGHNAYDVLVSDAPVFASKSIIDLLVCLNKDTYTLHNKQLIPSTLVMYDPDEFDFEEDRIKIKVPFKKILKELNGQAIMKNTIALGASLALLGTDLDELNNILTGQFSRKGDEIVNFNKQFAKAGFDYIYNNYAGQKVELLEKRENEKQLVLTGNESFALGAAIANCRLYVAYPMTPSSSVLSVLAAWQNKMGMVVRHAEDEISVINTALGGSIAGVRSAVGTSGGGFALMVESISFSGVAEIPIVIFLSSRPGPATGMPTWTEQGDLLFTVHAGHGEFPKIVLAPGTVEEMVELSVKAFDLADIYQVPVIVMSDMLLSESHKSMNESFVNGLVSTYKPDRGQTINKTDAKPYLRFKITDDGISPRLIPGQKGVFYQANSYEHLEDGHTTEDSSERIKQADKRDRKTATYLKNHFKSPEVIGDIDRSEIVFVSWGSTRGVLLEAQRDLQMKNISTSILHFTHMFPLDSNQITPYFSKQKRYILVENNAQGQFGKLLRMETGVTLSEKILKYDGRPLLREEIMSYVTKK
ncbi:2-oxoacid:acceptor oxidoreductase subunit alpha [Candidatus Roizmanbacteria bacterium CG_4_10_14_0_8_um_filter_39_9]|uniref:2-oxoacid:acceptor oxidoreductase subunit alpha n=1 Tax=Candidatus Roizmanbacteria bacterium CG_4_10_14_0_8_um_filter_39_9 TaxID=1974829 RepID=A0A2M7QE26_9BACT|nr:MAG: 2-oxoacid:acceptor oxidoreductase subunit alpha [Candidatus Roizmanbacteria bacterium CG_4_10_14_0_8_um_filter_39_9]